MKQFILKKNKILLSVKQVCEGSLIGEAGSSTSPISLIGEALSIIGRSCKGEVLGDC